MHRRTTFTFHVDAAAAAELVLRLLRRVIRRPCRAGISESAGVALGMFVVHVFTLTTVCVLSALYAFFNVTILKENLQQVSRRRRVIAVVAVAVVVAAH